MLSQVQYDHQSSQQLATIQDRLNSVYIPAGLFFWINFNIILSTQTIFQAPFSL